MLECTINLIPHGFRDLKRNLATVKVINDGSGNSRFGNYVVEYWTDRDPEIKTFRIEEFDRSKGAGELYKEVFNLIYQEEK